MTAPATTPLSLSLMPSKPRTGRRIVALEERVAALELLVAELAHAANRQAESLRYLQRQLNGEGLP